MNVRVSNNFFLLICNACMYSRYIFCMYCMYNLVWFRLIQDRQVFYFVSKIRCVVFNKMCVYMYVCMYDDLYQAGNNLELTPTRTARSRKFAEGSIVDRVQFGLSVVLLSKCRPEGSVSVARCLLRTEILWTNNNTVIARAI